MKRAIVAAILSMSAAAGQASAQTCPPVCVDPKTGQVVITPPPVHVEPPPVHVEPPPVHVEPPAVPPITPVSPPPIDLEAERIAKWRLYFEWEANLRAEVDATIAAQVRAQGHEAAARTPDPWAMRPVPWLGPVPDARLSFPRFEIGTLDGCVATFEGPGRPASWGFCFPFRVRLDDTWGFALDPSFLWQTHADIDFHTVGLHPALTYAFTQGHGHATGSHGYLRVGVDGWLPIDGGRATPDVLLGLHAGVGVHGQFGGWGMGAELRALARGGVGPADENMDRLRAGVEARVYMMTIAF